MDTLNYQLVSATQVDMTLFTPWFKGQIETCSISPLTTYSVGIASPLVPLPAGPQQRKVGLSR